MIPFCHLIQYEIQKYHQNELKFNGVYSKNNLPKVKDGAYVINLDEGKSIEISWIALYLNDNNSFGAEYISKKIKRFMRNKNIITNIYKTQEYDLIMCGYFRIGFIYFMLKGESLLKKHFTNLFSPDE